MRKEGRWGGGEEAAQGGSISAPSWEQSCVTQPWSSTNEHIRIESCPHLPDRLNPDWCRLRTGTAGTLLAQPAILEAAMVGTALVLRTTSWTGPSYSPRGTPCTSASCGREVRCEPGAAVHPFPPPQGPSPFTCSRGSPQPRALGAGRWWAAEGAHPAGTHLNQSSTVLCSTNLCILRHLAKTRVEQWPLYQYASQLCFRLCCLCSEAD